MIYEQLRYFNHDSEMNCNINVNTLESGQNIFYNRKVEKIGIQTLPGTRFILNSDTNNTCVVGSSGIWELDLSTYGQGLKINALAFTGKSIENIKTNDDAYLIIDMVYSEESTSA